LLKLNYYWYNFIGYDIIEDMLFPVIWKMLKIIIFVLNFYFCRARGHCESTLKKPSICLALSYLRHIDTYFIDFPSVHVLTGQSHFLGKCPASRFGPNAPLIQKFHDFFFSSTKSCQKFFYKYYKFQPVSLFRVEVRTWPTFLIKLDGQHITRITRGVKMPKNVAPERHECDFVLKMAKISTKSHSFRPVPHFW